MVSVVVLIPTFSSGILAGRGGCFPNLVRNCRWTIVNDRHSWNVSTQNAFSLPFAAILVNCAPCGEMHNYCTPHVIKENFESFLIHRCNYILLSQVYCVWQVVKTPTVILITLNTHIPCYIFGHVRNIAKSDYWLCHVRPSVRPSVLLEQLVFHWTDFHEIWYLNTFWKYVMKIQVSLKLDKE